MTVLLLDLQDRGDAWVANGLRAIYGADSLLVALDTDAASRLLAEHSGEIELFILCDEDSERLLQTHSRLVAGACLPPTIALSACTSVDTAVRLLRAGIDDLQVLDVGNAWQRQLPEVARALRQRIDEHRQRVHRDAELRASEQYLAQIVEGSAVAMFVIDGEHRVTHWNVACEVLTGMAAGKMVGTRNQWQAFYLQPRPCMADLVLDGGIDAHIARYYGSKHYRRSPTLDGTYEAEDFFPNFGDGGRWLFFTAAPLRDAEGRMIGAIETLQDVTEQKRAQQALHEKESLLRQIIECSSVATFVVNARHEVTHWNKACETLLGKTAETTVGTRELSEAVYATPRPVLADLVVDGADEETIARYYGKRYRRSPVVENVFEVDDYFPRLGPAGRWLHFAAAPLRNDAGETIGAIETLIDISDRKQVERRLKEGERTLSQIIDGLAVATFVIDREHRVTHWNRACATLTGLPAAELLGTRKQWRAFYSEERPCLADLVLDGAIESRIAQYYSAKKYHRSAIVEGGYEAQDFFPGFGDGGRWLYFTAAPLHADDGTVIGAIETLQDITEQKRAEEQLRQSEERYRLLSITDGMTGLYNARHFAQRIVEEMDRCGRYRHPLALMVLDVDNFKAFNDTWGHVQGDQVLIRLADCITQCLRRSDQAFRYGGEEFVALLPETDLAEAEAAAERIRAMFWSCEIAPTPDADVRCSASIGVTVFVPGEAPRDFVARADSGTYEAKRQGKNRVIRIPPPVSNT